VIFAAIRLMLWRRSPRQGLTVNDMHKEMTSQAEADEEILTFDIPDAVLEGAGSAEQKAFTLFYCTNQSSECGSRD
jgi:hypothetical protein